MVGRVQVVTGHVKTQLIAHDKEVYDIAFSRAGGGRDMFASVGKPRTKSNPDPNYLYFLFECSADGAVCVFFLTRCGWLCENV